MLLRTVSTGKRFYLQIFSYQFVIYAEVSNSLEEYFFIAGMPVFEDLIITFEMT